MVRRIIVQSRQYPDSHWWICSLVCLGLWTAGANAFTGSDAFVEYRRNGREVIQEHNHDFSQDGQKDVLVIGHGPGGLEVSAYRNEGQNQYTLMSRSRPIQAEILVSFQPIALANETGFLLRALEDSPDEADHFVQLFRVNSAGLVSIWSHRYRLEYQQHETGRTSNEEVDYGGFALGLRVLDSSKVRWPSIEINATLPFMEPSRKPLCSRMRTGPRIPKSM